MDRSEEWVSLREFARRLSVNPFAVQQAIDNGRIERRAADKKIHWPTQELAWEFNRDPGKRRDLDDDEGEEDESGSAAYMAAKVRKERAIAGLKEIELAQAKGELVQSSQVKAAMAQFAIDVREAIMAIPDRVASEAAAEVARSGASDQETIREIVHRLWRRESRRVLERIGHAGDSGKTGRKRRKQ